LSDLRDAEALLETYDKLGARFAEEVDRRPHCTRAARARCAAPAFC
jgi:hypothetical protein